MGPLFVVAFDTLIEAGLVASVFSVSLNSARHCGQADCQFNGYPTEVLMVHNHQKGDFNYFKDHEYPFGEIPATGTSDEVEGAVFVFDD